MIGFVINRLAGNGRGERIWLQAEKALRDKGVAYGCRFTERPGHASELAREWAATNGLSAVVAVGGDGTVHEAANGLAGTTMPFGFIPAGSGNDFARSMQIPSDWQGALERVLKLESRPIDVGAINGKLFAISAGIGFDGEVARLTNRSWYKRWLNRLGVGSLSYVVTVLRLLVTYRPCDVELDIDGRKLSARNVWLLAVANMPYYGGGMKICPDAKYDDGILHMCLVENIGRLSFLRFFPLVFRGTHVAHPSVKLLSGRHMTVAGASPMTIHTDGEYGGETPATVDIVPRRLFVL